MTSIEHETFTDTQLARAYLSRTLEPGTGGPDLARWLDSRTVEEAAAELQAGIAPGVVQSLAGPRALTNTALADLRRAAQVGARLIGPGDPEWPFTAETPTWWERAQIQPPIALWVRGEGNLRDLLVGSVAIVGARASTAYGEHVAAELAHGLAEKKRTVVSGGAYGIDAAAHRGALAAGAPTIAVLACGVDRVYPAAHSALFARILDAGLLVSELAPGSAPLRHRFLTRNRLIAGLTDGTVVVESAARSGSLNTVKHAAQLGRPVMAVPGPTTSAMSVGCHQLLREGTARLVSTAADVLEELGEGNPPRRDVHDTGHLTPLQATVLRAVPVTSGTTTDSLARLLGADRNEVDRVLGELQEQGLVHRSGGWRASLVQQAADPGQALTDVAQQVLAACPTQASGTPKQLAARAGVDLVDVLRVLPALELADLVEWTGTGWRRRG